MFIVVLLLSIFVLWNNLKGYKKLFVTDKYMNQELNESFKDISREDTKGLAIFMMLLISILPLSFYCVAANVFIDNKILLGYSIMSIILTLFRIKTFINFISSGKNVNRNLISRILYPVNTLFIGYFIYIYMINLS